MNRNYKNGAAKEYRVRKKLLEEGWDIVIRSAGSHSSFDLVAIKAPQFGTEGQMMLIQCKPNGAVYERNKAWEEIKRFAGYYRVVSSVI